MKRVIQGLVACSLVVGCSSAPGGDGAVDTAQQDLDATQASSLTRMEGNLSSTSETVRENDTRAYYNAVITSASGFGALPQTSITTVLPTLNAFISRYGFGGGDPTVQYYNRGDLGIGREMHCADRLATTGEVACYVRNFAGGDDKGEFKFGLSSTVAFDNIAINHPFATVAMVFRQSASTNKVFFVVYDANGTQGGNLAFAAALDRAGNLFNDAFSVNGDTSTLGTPGVNFNNHIPTNCMTCHGGKPYDTSTHNVVGSLFLPFDLDQFEYNPSSANLAAFKSLNQTVRRVAVAAGTPIDIDNSLRNQLDGWYGNTTHAAAFGRTAAFTPFVPAGWQGSPDSIAVYQNVVRGTCRNCHVVNDKAANGHALYHFDDEASFKAQLPIIAIDIQNNVMPHSLQSVRNFWQSAQPAALEAYMRSVGNTSQANTLHNAGPGNLATLDPHLILSSAVQ